jgi:sugar-specific transcriptional regulator TrmB
MKELEEFGLTKTEAKVYVALLKLGQVSAAPIIKKTQLHRTTVYDVLERLIEKGVVNFIIRDDKKYFEAASAEKFLDIASEEKEKAEDKEKLAKKLIPDLKRLSEIAKEKSIARVYIGNEGLKTIMNDIIETGKDFLGYGGELTFGERLPVYTRIWAEKRRKKNIKAKLIGSVGTEAPVWKLNECKEVSKDYFSPASTLIYGNKIAIILEEEPLVIILIESEKLARGYKAYFNLLWSKAKKS